METPLTIKWNITRKIQRHPSFASSWTKVAKAHLEFFRIHEDEAGWKCHIERKIRQYFKD